MGKRYFAFSAFVITILLVLARPVYAVEGRVANLKGAFMHIDRNRATNTIPSALIPQVNVLTPSYPIGMDSSETRLVKYSFQETGNASGRITSRQYQFFTQYDVPLSDVMGPYPGSIAIHALETSQWDEYIYLPKSIMDRARAMDEYAIVLKTTFTGKSASGAEFSTQASLLILFPPAAFSKSSPSNQGTLSPVNPLLTWNGSVGALEYEYCFDTIDNNSCDTDWTGTYWPGTYDTQTVLQDLPVNTTFYWQVRAKNTAGTTYANHGNWWSFSTGITPPGLSLPTDGEFLLHRRPAFDWEDVSGAESYTLQVSRGATFGSIVLNLTVTDSSYLPTADLANNKLFYWRVRTNTSLGESPWSEVHTFTTGNPPSIPSLSAPGNNALVSGPSPLFNWSNSTVPAGVVFDRYQIQIATDSGFVNIAYEGTISGIANSQTNAAVLTPATTYYWRVRSFSIAGHYSSWSKVRSVRIKYAAPLLIMPPSGTTVGSLKPTFNWNAVSGATGYTLQISKTSNFSSLVHNKLLTNPTFTPAASLAHTTTYYWRVRANGLYGPGGWSAVFTFTTP